MLIDLYRNELSKPVDAQVRGFAADVAARHAGALGVLFYGSCLREARLDGLMLDFYLIVDSYERAYDRAWLARANALVPPNVFHARWQGLVAKYAVLSLDDLQRECRGETRSVSVWARFCQPARLAWGAGLPAADRIISAVANSPVTLMNTARPLLPQETDMRSLWSSAFALTYAAELRAERKERPGAVFDAAPDWYRSITAPALAEAKLDAEISGTLIRFRDAVDRRAGERAWARRRRNGKLISVARLAKATATFDGGIDYLAWKINRHAGSDIRISDWQRRHPILAGITLLPQLLKSGAVK
ncbi:hypothetical protein ACSMXM_07320 [Pacificimonas sp. ICDLI1SI03]